MNIWIIDSRKGIKLFYKSFLKIVVDEDLVSGLLTAFNQFTMGQFQQPIESIDMGGLRWIYMMETDFNLIFVAADTKDVSAELLQGRLNIVRRAFIEEYIMKGSIQNYDWNVNLEMFNPFEEIIENYYYQWEDAEIMTSLADFFDLLGVIQQIMIMLKEILDTFLEGGKRIIIFEKIENLIDEFKNREEIKNDKEFQNFSFSRNDGFNIININPTNCDPILFKSSILTIMKGVVEIFRKEIGESLCLSYFRERKLFNYLFENIILLKQINLDMFLLKLLLFL